MYSSKRTVDPKFWLVGLVVPMVLFLSLFFIVRIFFTEEYLIMNYLRYGMDVDIPLIRNIIEYSPYPALFLSVFYLSFITSPIQIFYWYKVYDFLSLSNLRVSYLKYWLIMLPLIALCLSVWFMDVDDMSDRRDDFFEYIFMNIFFFYFFIILPIHFYILTVSKFILGVSYNLKEHRKGVKWHGW
jgi:hypothetical protein